MYLYDTLFLLLNFAVPILKKLLIKAYNLGDAIVTPTPYSKRLLEGYKGSENKKIYAISNGIEMAFFKKDEKLGKKFRKDYDYIDKAKIVVEMAKTIPFILFLCHNF